MKFQDFKYHVPTQEELKAKTSHFENAFAEATTAAEQIDIIYDFFTYQKEFSTSYNIVSIRYSQDTMDELRSRENEIFDEIAPQFEALKSRVYGHILASPFRKELEREFGTHFFRIVETDTKLFRDEIIPLLEEENKLVSQYQKLRSSASLFFDGKERNLAQMDKYAESPDRAVRKESIDLVQKFFEENEAQFDEIYDKQVKVRVKIAEALGFDNYADYKYLLMHRFDYNRHDVERYREQIKKYILPISEKLRQAQAKRIGTDRITYYDSNVMFLDGNAVPQGEEAWIVDKAVKMYREMSKETGEFIDLMVGSDLLDLDARKGKAGGGYCTFIDNYKAPFIFANFNGTSHDVDVLTHEAGHAFMCYCARDFKVPDLVWPTMEACEIHSMSMEFFAYPWIDSFFLHQTEKYKYFHVASSILFLLYGSLVDHFQHEVYAHPEMTPDERKAVWARLQEEYLPHIDRSESAFLSKGTFWYKQGHIFSNPFYYIDYTLAQVCAFQYFIWSLEDREAAFASYLNLCKLGGTMPFLSLVKEAGLESPFEEQAFEKIFRKLAERLEKSGF